MELKGSKTEQNLMTAFAGESQARNKYTYFASKAKKDGYVQIAKIFEETANNEKEHAKLWFKLLCGGEIPDTAENLAAAAEGENYEWTDMYKEFAAVAKEEGFDRIAYLFSAVGEIEKAHEDVFNMFLQILDDGRLTDNKGKTVDFKNTIIIMTSNIGSSYLLENKDEDGIEPQIRDQVMNEMKMRFKPEFLNRVDDIIMFKPLSENGITKIIDIFVNEVANRLKDRNISLDITPAAKHILAVEGYDPVYGARPLKRYIQNTLENKLARLIIAGEINYGSHVTIDGVDDEIIIKSE